MAGRIKCQKLLNLILLKINKNTFSFDIFCFFPCLVRLHRFDVRGYLHDLKPYQAKSNTIGKDGLTEEELEMERICDEERFKDLNQSESDCHGIYLSFNCCYFFTNYFLCR